MNSVTITTKSGVDHNMSIETYARWMCLVEAMDFADKYAERSNFDISKSSAWIKPLAFHKYIDERYHAMLHDVKVEEQIALDLFTQLPSFDDINVDLDSESLEFESLCEMHQ
jgi:hypothetical protein